MMLVLGFRTLVVFVLCIKEKCLSAHDKNVITIGALFHEDETQVRVPLRNLISKNNYHYGERDLVFNLSTQVNSRLNAFNAAKRVCNFIAGERNLVAVLNTGFSNSPPIVQSVINKLELPYIQSNWNDLDSFLPNELSINLYPNPDDMAQALKVIIDGSQWKKFLILYDSDDSLIKLRYVLNMEKYENGVSNSILIRKFDRSVDEKSFLKSLKIYGRIPFVLDFTADKISDFFQRLQEVQLLDFFPGYFLTSLDAHTINLPQITENVNVTSIRILDVESVHFRKTIENWKTTDILYHARENDISPYMVKTETALVYDATRLLMEAVKDMHRTYNLELVDTLNCESSELATSGSNIISHMKLVNIFDFDKTVDQTKYQNDAGPFLTGPFNFDEMGRRQNFTVYIIEGTRGNTLATWNSQYPEDLNLQYDLQESSDKILKGLQQSVLTVSTKIEVPFLMLKESPGSDSDEDTYEGYVMDLIKAIADINKFKFRIHLNIHGKNGEFNPATQKWDGLIGDILDDTAQLAIADLTITPEREKYVDFSQPFMRSGISVLYKKTYASIGMFDFLVPFSGKVWMCTVTLYLAMSLILYFVARMAPGDWENPNQPDPTELQNIWNVKNCMWLTLASIMNQGPDELPKGISSRFVSSMWWFFALIMINSYTASLAAYLTTNKMTEITNIEDLAKQNRIKYGCVRGGSTESFLRQSNYSAYQRLYANMLLSSPTVFESNNYNGIKRVQSSKDGLYAFFMESAFIEYAVNANCDLATVRKPINRLEYGIAMPTDYRYRFAINDAILQLQEKGNLSTFKEKWWKVRNEKPKCKAVLKNDKLTLSHVGGVFLVVGAIILIGILSGFFEFLWSVRTISIRRNIKFWTVLKWETLFAVNVAATKKRDVRCKLRAKSSRPEKNKNPGSQLLQKSTPEN